MQSIPAVGSFTVTGQIRVVLLQSGQLVHAPVGGIGVALSADLGPLAKLAGETDKIAYFIDADTAALTGLSAFMRTVLDDADAATFRATTGTNSATNLTAGTLPDARVSATLTADKAFRRGNILGTVSESSSTPTGALIERNSNANGEYVRFADGTQICAANINGDPVNNNAGLELLWTYPAAFSGNPVLLGMGGVVTSQTSGIAARVAMGLPQSAPGATQTRIHIYNTTGVNLGGTSISVTTVGRWF